jgi:predicted DNA-binding transcriptional regulator AlpA
MMGPGKITRRQEATIAALLEMPTTAAAAKVAGISEPTLWRWLQQPEFQEQYRNAKRRVVEQAITSVQKATGEAVSTLREIMNDKEAPTSSRVSAAKTILETAIKTVEIEGILTRLEALEQAQAEKETR